MSQMGHSLQTVGRRKLLHVRTAPKAAVGCQSVVRRDGPHSDILWVAQHLPRSVAAVKLRQHHHIGCALLSPVREQRPAPESSRG